MKIFSRGQQVKTVNSFLGSGNFCPLLTTFANSLDQDQDPYYSNMIVFRKEFFLKELILNKKSAEDNKIRKITQHANS